MILKSIGFILIIVISLLMISDIENLFEVDKLNGELVKAHITSELILAGQPEVFEVTVRNPSKNSRFMLEVQRDSQIIAYTNMKFDNVTVKIISLRSNLPPVSGKSVYKYTLYPGIIGGTSIPISYIIENRRIYTQKELSDLDRDNLRYFEEIELGTNPEMSDTDADGIPDNLDDYPTKH